MDIQKVYKLPFLNNLERDNIIKEFTDFNDYVEDGKFEIVHEGVHTSIIYNKNDLIKEFTSIADDKEQLVHLRNIATRVLLENANLELVAESYKNRILLPHDKLHSLVEVLLTVEDYRANSLNPKLKTYNQQKLKITKLFCDHADNIIKYISDGLCDKEYLCKLMCKFFQFTTIEEDKGLPHYKHIVNFKMMELNSLVNELSNDKPVYKECYDECKSNSGSPVQSIIDIHNLIDGISEDSRFVQNIMIEKDKLESQIDIILADYSINGVTTNIQTNISDNVKHEVVPTIMHYIRSHDVCIVERLPELIRNQKYSTCIDYVDVFRMKVAYPKLSFEKVNGECTLASDYINLFLLMKDCETNDIVKVPLVTNCVMTKNLEFLLGGDVSLDNVNVTLVKFRGKKEDYGSVTEGIKFTEDGGFKLTYKPGKSYMDDYSNINRILVQNARNGNMDAVKQDLVYLFAFIDELESTLKGKGKLNEAVKEDIIKARMFAKGDFKQYLSIVQETDPEFNFAKYYEENYVNNDKVLVEFTNAEIKGFKKLLRTIIG